MTRNSRATSASTRSIRLETVSSSLSNRLMRTAHQPNHTQAGSPPRLRFCRAVPREAHRPASRQRRYNPFVTTKVTT
jgi:hypothetical protein